MFLPWHWCSVSICNHYEIFGILKGNLWMRYLMIRLKKWKDQIDITIYETCFYIGKKVTKKFFYAFDLWLCGVHKLVVIFLDFIGDFFRFLGENLRISWWCFGFLPELLISGRRAIVECMNLGGSCTIKILRAILQVVPISDPLTSLPCLPKL